MKKYLVVVLCFRIMWNLIVLVICVGISPSFAQNNTCIQKGFTFQDSNDCKYYYLCDTNTTSVRLKCGAHLYWHCDMKTCDYKIQKNCCPNSNAYIVGGMEVPCLIKGAKLPILRQCRNYLQCVDGYWRNYSCNAGERFDVIRMKCVTARFGRCATKVTIPPNNSSYNATTPKPATLNFCFGSMKVQNVLDCTSYYKCVNNKIQKQSCPSNQTYYNCLTGKCVSNRNALCCVGKANIPQPTTQNCTQNGTRAPVPMSCVSYYECVNGTMVKQNCGNNQAFDIWSLQCMSPISARCALKPGLTVCSAGMNGTLPIGSFTFDINVACLKW